RAEDVGEARRDDRPEAVVLQSPRRVLAARAAAEVAPRDEDLVARQVPVGLLGPVEEEELAEARALHALEELLGDDLVGVDVVAVEDRHRPRDRLDGLHGQLQSRMSTKWPSMAAAAAIAGLTRWVRPPRPWRPSKLRFEVEAQRPPGSSRSAFMARHIEQPWMRHSKPASRKILSRPSFSASCFTRPEPGTTMAETPAATLRPLAISAAARRSSMRPLVHEPMNTRWIGTSTSLVPGVRPM